MAVKNARVAFALLALAVLFLMLFSGTALLLAVAWLPHSQPLPLAYESLNAINSSALRFSIMVGLLGGGMAVARFESGSRWLVMIWSVYAVLSLATAAAGIPAWSILQAIEAILLVATAIPVLRLIRQTPLGVVWGAGVLLAAFSGLLSLLPPGNPASALLVDAVSTGLRDWIAYPLAAQALAYWLVRRFSTVDAGWADESLLTTGGLIALAGALVVVSRLSPLLAMPLLRHAANGAAVILPLLALIVAAHAYRALANRNQSATLAAHWVALALLLFLLAVGLLAPITALPAIRLWAAGTLFDQAAQFFIRLFPLAVVAGVVNQVASDLHGQNGRVTGLMPFWLVLFGWVGAGSSLALAGVVQVYLVRVAGMQPTTLVSLLEPLFIVGVLSWLSAVPGAAIYALGFWYRRPPVGGLI